VKYIFAQLSLANQHKIRNFITTQGGILVMNKKILISIIVFVIVITTLLVNSVLAAPCTQDNERFGIVVVLENSSARIQNFDWAAAMIGLDMINTADLLLAYMDSNLGVTQEQLEAYLKQLIRTNAIRPAISNKSIVGTTSLPGSPDVMGPNTRAVFNSNPIWGVVALREGHYAQTAAARRWGATSLHNGNGDAFRHAAWNALMMLYIGSRSFVERFATAWEDDGDLNGQPAIERQMDIINNRLGLNMGANNPNAGPMELENMVKNAITAGRGVRIVNGRIVVTNSAGSIW